MTELIWDGKYTKDGKKQGPVRIALPFQTIETVNESAQERQRSLELSSAGREPEWRNRLIWGDKKYVLPSLLPEFAGKVDLIYIDPPFDTGANFSFAATIPQHPATLEDETTLFTKEPSVLEQKAYRDTWGRGLDSYLQWFCDCVLIMRELLRAEGSIYSEAVKLPAQFAALAPKVREFFERKAFGESVNLDDPAIVKAMSTAVAHYVCVDVFKKELQKLTVEKQTPRLLEPARMLSTCQPFPWSRPVWEGQKCVFNLVPCDNDFEREFAKFLDNAPDVRAFSKLPRSFGFAIEYTDAVMNLRNYEPDFVAVDRGGTHWLLESKGQETIDVLRKDAAALRWCENATRLTGTEWKYVKVPQKEFQALQPSRLSDLSALAPSVL
jgi:hypothetical protein